MYRLPNRKGIEKLLTDFLIELEKNPIDFQPDGLHTYIKNGYVSMAYYYKKFSIDNLELMEILDCIVFDRYVHLLQRTEKRNETIANVHIELSINLRGKEFIKYGGYIQEKIDREKERNKDFKNGLIAGISAACVGAALTAILGYLLLPNQQPPPKPLPDVLKVQIVK